MRKGIRAGITPGLPVPLMYYASFDSKLIHSVRGC